MKGATFRRRASRWLVLLLLVQAFALPAGSPSASAAEPAEAPAGLVLIDNGDPGYAENPAWSSSSVKGYNGSTTRVTGGVGHTATWTPAPGTVQGTYKVSVYKVKRPTATDDPSVKLEVAHAGAVDTVYMDATQGTSGWFELGTYAFDGHGGEFVSMTKTTTAANTFVHADAVKFERVAADGNDASLSSLRLNGAAGPLGALTPTFSPSVTAYTYAVSPETAAITVTATVYDPQAVLTVNGVSVASGSPSADIPLAVGDTPVRVEVTAADGATKRAYTIMVTRPAAQPHNTIVIDFGDPGYSETGTWSTSNTVKGVNGSSTRYSTAAGASITWKPNVTAGTATVSYFKVNWPASADPNVRLEIAHAGGIETKTINLTPATEGWIELGTYAFAGTPNEYVRLTRVSSGSVYTRADAVKFEGTIAPKPAPPGPVRGRTLNNLQYAEKGTIANDDYKATFYEATWDGGRTIVKDLYHKENGVWVPMNAESERLEEQWVLLEGESGDRTNYYDTMTPEWVLFNGFAKTDDRTVVLTDSRHPDRYGFSVVWSLAGERPRLAYDFTPRQDGNYVIGYQSFTEEPLADVSEVLSGARNRAKMVGTVESTGLWELTAPMALVEKKDAAGNPRTYGVYVPADRLPLRFEPYGGATNQPLGMSLVNDGRNVQPIVYAPQAGTYSKLKANETYSFGIGLYAESGSVYDAYTDILRNDYDYTAYRENVEDGSLTDAMFNMIDLLAIEPDRDDSVDFVPSLSGWWSRAKGFVDIENQDAVRNAASSVLLGAYYLTGDDRLYDSRALPMLQYGVSRNERGWSPKKTPVYNDPSLWKMAAVPFDSTTVSTFYDMTRGLNAGLYGLGQEEYRFRNPDQFGRGPVIQPLMMYRMTGDAAYLDEAKTAADRYIAEQIDTPSTANPDRTNFFYNYGKLWMELLELYEETKETRYLDAAAKEARRYATIFTARPVPEGTVSIPQPQPFQYYLAFRWDDKYRYPYERSKLPEETAGGVQAPGWLVSPNGLTFEAGDTSGAYRMNAQEAPFLLRLASYTGDELLKDIAHNTVIGRYTNYPGYYYRGLIESQLDPDFPLRGPTEATSIYYHHAPAQLGQTMDYLVTEQTTRSNGLISFPAVFETNYLWFKYHLYGSKPGTFYGHSGVWLWMPKGIIATGNPQLNWITAESGDKLYVGLTNASKSAQQATIELNADIVGFDPAVSYPVTIIADNGAPVQTTMVGGSIPVTVSGRGITAVIVDGMNIDVPLHRTEPAKDTSDKSYFFDTHSPIDAVKGMLLVKPDHSAYDAYVQAKTTNPATLHYSTDGGTTYTAVPDDIYPMEWSVRVPDLSVPFTYYVESDGKRTQARTIYLPDHVTQPPGQPPQQAGPPVTVVDNVEAEVEGSWARATFADSYYYDNYVTAKTSGDGNAKLRWRPDLKRGGLYDVYYRLPAGRPEWSTAAKFTVYDEAGAHTYTVDERGTNGRWVKLGRHSFAAGTGGCVELTNAASGSAVVGDAIMWIHEDVVPTWESATLSADKPALVRTKPVQLTVTGMLDTGVVGDLSGASIVYEVDRADLASVDSQGRLTLEKLDLSTDRIAVKAVVTVDGVVLESKPLVMPIRDLSETVDTSDAGRYAETGLWKASSLTGYDKNVRSKYTEEQGATATWKPDLPAGTYAVSFYNIVRQPGADPAVRLETKHAGGTEVRTLDASAGASGWIDLGTYAFAGDGTEYVKLTRQSPSSTLETPIYTRADAVRFDSYSLLASLASPSSGGELPHGASLELAFNRPLDPATVVPGSVTLTEIGAGVPVDVILSVGADGKRIVATPTSPLAPDTAYRLAVGPGIAGADGVPLSPYALADFPFRTAKAAPDETAPTIALDGPLSVARTEKWAAEPVVTDAQSGVGRVALYLDDAAVERLAAAELELAAGEHRIRIVAADGAGNVAEAAFALRVTLDPPRLGDVLAIGRARGWIGNAGIYRSMTAKAERAADADARKREQALDALANEVRAQSGKHVDAGFAQQLLADIAYLNAAEEAEA
ncbi:cadherin-like beta sandwich domain-containing protein [Paenibacillus flagellatus]|uniref:golvesin C-terminal-like domain-containing protein n=1 Tax=Paenibacillus flagellatus TaxID=2211139 RepID=UPI00130547B6|nr:cadherin-like beta sandwich domain-containing protein [Paenibacillus flagellatus]